MCFPQNTLMVWCGTPATKKTGKTEMLESMGWVPQYTLEDGIEELIKTYTILISDLSSTYRNDIPLGYGIK